jgi:SAM-dependent methyltransferase
MSDEAGNITGLYERHARTFDRLRGRELFERIWLDRFTSYLPQGGAVLDIGCGMGEPIAAHLIGQGYAVTGVDAAPSLIAFCRERFPDQSWQVADMRTLDLGRTFHGVLAWDSFFHLKQDDQRRMFSVFRAHAALGAVLMFTSGPEAGEAVGIFEGEPLYHASLDPAEYRALLVDNGFEVLAYTAEDAACGGHTVWLARRLQVPITGT